MVCDLFQKAWLTKNIINISTSFLKQTAKIPAWITWMKLNVHLQNFKFNPCKFVDSFHACNLRLATSMICCLPVVRAETRGWPRVSAICQLHYWTELSDTSGQNFNRPKFDTKSVSDDGVYRAAPGFSRFCEKLLTVEWFLLVCGRDKCIIAEKKIPW